MIRQLLNTLFVQAQHAYIRLDGDTLRVEVDDACRLQVPLQHLGSVVLFGDAMMSPAAMGRCAANGPLASLCGADAWFRKGEPLERFLAKVVAVCTPDGGSYCERVTCLG